MCKCDVHYIATGFLLLFIYAMINMNIVSWGTREVTHADDVDVDAANRVKQPNAWTSFIHEVRVVCISIQALHSDVIFTVGLSPCHVAVHVMVCCYGDNAYI